MRKSDFYFCGVRQFTGRSSQCSTCPDSANCARLLEEKWRQAYNAVFRFGLSSSSGLYVWLIVLPLYLGPCQPSIVYRFLRTLEGVSPPLSLTHLACQTTAKAFTATCTSDLFPHLPSSICSTKFASVRPNVLFGSAWQWHRHRSARCTCRCCC